MDEKGTGTETTLRLKRTFGAAREKVFRAWTEPEALKKWFAPADDHSTPFAQVDLRVGGKYQIDIKSPEGKVFRLGGTFREVRPPEKLVYTWAWEGDKDVGETLVTVEFREQGTSTEVALTHELFPNEEALKGHDAGWSGSLDRLARMLEK
jgi:uncharacterized protein YndB with AHSA1/START domain